MPAGLHEERSRLALHVDEEGVRRQDFGVERFEILLEARTVAVELEIGCKGREGGV